MEESEFWVRFTHGTGFRASYMQGACAARLSRARILSRTLMVLAACLVLLCLVSLFPGNAYADQAPKDYDTNYEPAPNQVINTLQDSRGDTIGSMAEDHGGSEVAASGTDSESGAPADGSAAEEEAGSTVSPEVVEAEPLRLGAWFVENDKSALYRAQRAAADLEPTKPSPPDQSDKVESLPATSEWLQPVFLMLTGAILCVVLAVVVLTKAHLAAKNASYALAGTKRKPITDKTVR